MDLNSAPCRGGGLESQHLSPWHHHHRIAEIDLGVTNGELVVIELEIQTATRKHNPFLTHLGLSLIPLGDSGGMTS